MDLISLIEAILFAAQKPLPLKEIKNLVIKPAEFVNTERTHAFKKVTESEISAAIQQLKIDYTQQGRSFQIQEVADAFQLVSQPQFAPWLKQLFDEHRSHRLSLAALETLAIIAYRQPITRADIEAVRGVIVDSVMQTLLERRLITMTGRSQTPGHPMLYGTTRSFLEYFGLNDINQLPAVEELRRVNLQPQASSSAQSSLLAKATPCEESPHV